MSFFRLASRKMEWLSARQKVIAENVANADTPGYKARDVASFAETLESVTTSARWRAPPRTTSPAPIRSAPACAWKRTRMPGSVRASTATRLFWNSRRSGRRKPPRTTGLRPVSTARATSW
ncbi:flagellar basal body rod protein FlgB [Seohaeicola zhoushanensis]